jgi:hypothetical protein
MKFQLTIAEGTEAGREFIFEQESVVIGRTPECDIILYSPGVSRTHARIYSQGQNYFIEDMGSSNGTLVNGALVKKHKLSDGDNLALGPVTFSFTSKVANADGSTRILPSRQVKPAKKKKAAALLPAGTNEKQAKAMARSRTTAMPAVKKPASKGLAPAAPSTPAKPERPSALSAAEKARIRRESGRPLGEARILWASSSKPARAALSTVAVALALGLFVAIYWFFGRSGNSPVRKEPSNLSEVAIADSFGAGEGVDWQKVESKQFTFNFQTPVRAVVLVHFQSKDISPGEVVVSANGIDIGTVPPDTVRSVEILHEMIVPPEALKKGLINQLSFDNVRNRPPHVDSWRIWNLWIETVQLPELPPDMLLKKAKESIEAAQLSFDRREVGAKNRYEAWKGFRNAWLMLETPSLRSTELYRLALEKVREAQQELDRKCSELLLEEEAYYSHKDYKAARSTLDYVKEYFPNPDQLCGQLAEQKRALHNL